MTLSKVVREGKGRWKHLLMIKGLKTQRLTVTINWGRAL